MPAAGVPKPDVAIALRDGRFLHLAPLPFGALAGTVVGDATFDASGTRAVALATFLGASITGSWRSANPTQAFLIDAQRRIVTQLTTSGTATGAAWDGRSGVRIREGAGITDVSVGEAAGGLLPAARFVRAAGIPPGSSFVSGKSTDRLAVYKTPDGRYAVLQIGARRFRISGIARNGAYAIIGSYLAWIDGQRHIARQVTRFGPDNAEPLEFSGSPYGDALHPILPLGNPVYQASYRNGVAYFAFSYGVERIVAATSDLVNFWYPQLPHEPVFTVGEGLGVSPDGALYFVRPEEDVMLFTHAGHYVRQRMTGLDVARDVRPLRAALRTPLHPSENALDAALAQWRFYPVGDASGERWVATHLGRLLIGDSSGHFTPGIAPGFPFAVLGRTDDGRIWGATAGGSRLRLLAGPQQMTKFQMLADASSTIWWSADAVSWHEAATIAGDAGAVGSHSGGVWIAATRWLFGRAMICVARLNRPSPDQWPTAATYAGEELSFADLPSGFYLLWGATQGFRLSGAGGPLSAFRLDPEELGLTGSAGNNSYVSQLLAPDTDPSLPDAGVVISGADAFLEPSLAAARQLEPIRRLTLRTNIEPSLAPAGVTVMGLEQERAFELKYAGTPNPLATVIAKVSGDDATVARSLALGPLRASGSTEAWKRDGAGWHLRAVISHFSY